MLTLNIDEALEAQIRKAAADSGEDVNQYAVAMLAEAIARKHEEKEQARSWWNHLSDAERHKEIERTREAIEQANAGKAKPIAQVIEEARARHGLPPDWGTGRYALSDEDWKAIDAAHENS